MLRLLALTLAALAARALAQDAAPPTPPPTPPPEAVAAPAPAAEAAAPEAAPEVTGVELSLKAGGHFPQVANPLETSFDATLKVGYSLPFLERRLQLFLDLGYTTPSVTLTAADARVPGGEYTSTMTLQDLATTVGLAVFLLEPSRPLVPYLAAGARVHFLKATTVGTAGTAYLGEYVETDTQVGGHFALGAGYRLGPGRVLAELAFDYLPVSQRLTGSSNASSLGVLLGYGLFF